MSAFVLATWNLWKDKNWPQRSDALQKFLRLHDPDVLAVQELSRVVRDLIDVVLPTHERIDDPFVGWESEGNIYWRKEVFVCTAHGAEDVGLMADRRLFWVRLEHKAEARHLLLANVHFSWAGEDEERQTGKNFRIEQAKLTVDVLDKLRVGSEPVVLAGDLNDASHAPWILQQKGGLTDARTPISPLPSR